MQVVVVRNKYDNIVDGQGLVLRDVPAGTLLPRVRAADRQFRPAAFQVTVAVGRAIVQDVRLKAWRGQVASGE